MAQNFSEEKLLDKDVLVEVKLLKGGDDNVGTILYNGKYKGIFALSGIDMIVLENGWYHNLAGVNWAGSQRIKFETALVKLEEVVSIAVADKSWAAENEKE